MIEAGGYSRLLKFAEGWKRPEFPLSGRDLLALGATPGPEVGGMLKTLEDRWVESGFALGRDALLQRATEMMKDKGRAGKPA